MTCQLKFETTFVSPKPKLNWGTMDIFLAIGISYPAPAFSSNRTRTSLSELFAV